MNDVAQKSETELRDWLYNDLPMMGDNEKKEYDACVEECIQMYQTQPFPKFKGAINDRKRKRLLAKELRWRTNKALGYTGLTAWFASFILSWIARKIIERLLAFILEKKLKSE